MHPDEYKFKIFISHKSIDKELASRVKDVLQGLSPKKITAWVSGEDIADGADWNRAIKRQLAESHLLLLLYTRESFEWDWCLYEAGLFTRFDREDVSSVVCLYPREGGPPRPLSNLQGVIVEAGHLATFLGRLCRETWRISDDWRFGALAPRIGPARIAKAAQRIAADFRKALEDHATSGDDMYYPCHRVVLDFGPANGRRWDRIPEDAVIVEGAPNTSAYTLSLFGYAEGRRTWTWGDLIAGVDGQLADWRSELDGAFASALAEELFAPGTDSFKAWDPRHQRQRQYRPVLYRVLRSGPARQPVGATILLQPEPEV